MKKRVKTHEVFSRKIFSLSTVTDNLIGRKAIISMLLMPISLRRFLGFGSIVWVFWVFPSFLHNLP